MYQVWDFTTVEVARTAEDYTLAHATEMGFGSKDHSEFIVDISMARLADLFLEAVECGVEHDIQAEAIEIA